MLLRDQLAATHEALWKAGEANRIARDSAQKQLRAYLGYPAVWIPDIGPEARFTVRNYGHTPAFDVVTTCLIDGGRPSTHGIGIVDPAQENVHRFGIPDIVRRTAGTDFVEKHLSVTLETSYRDIDGDYWSKTQSFEVNVGDPIKLRDGSHIADFSRAHGGSSERKIDPPE